MARDIEMIIDKIDTLAKKVDKFMEYTYRQDEQIKTLEHQYERGGRVTKLEDKLDKMNTTLGNLKLQLALVSTGIAGGVMAVIEAFKFLTSGGLK